MYELYESMLTCQMFLYFLDFLDIAHCRGQTISMHKKFPVKTSHHWAASSSFLKSFNIT